MNRSSILFRIFALVLFLFLPFGCEKEGEGKRAGGTNSSPYFDPFSPGPYRVGVRHALYFDSTRRAMRWQGCGAPSCPRPLPLTYWYPAEPPEGVSPSSLSDLIGVTEGTLNEILLKVAEEQGFDVGGLRVKLGEIPLQGILNAPLRPGRYPLLIFSHGAGGIRFQNLFQTEYLASHGYIIVAVDHEGDATVTLINGEIVTVDARRFVASALERPLDIEFLINLHERLNEEPDSWLYQSLTGAIGLFGHSFGAYTSLIVSARDPRVGAIVPMAAPGIPTLSRSVPTLLMIAGEDDTIETAGNEGVQAVFDLILPPKGFLNLLDAGHFTFSNMCDIIPDFGDGCGTGRRIRDGTPLTYIPPSLAHRVISGLTTAWFGLYLKGNPRYEDTLMNAPTPEGVRLEYRWIP